MYFDILPKDVIIIIVSKLESIEDITIMSDMFNLKNMDYMKLCSIYHPKLFPVKFMYGDIPERYSWTNLYFNFLNKDLYNCDIISYITGENKNECEHFTMNPVIIIFLVLTGKLPVIKLRKYIQKLLNASEVGDSYFYESFNYIEDDILPIVYAKMLENERYHHIIELSKFLRIIGRYVNFDKIPKLVLDEINKLD